GGNLVLAEGATPTLSTGAGTAGNILISGSTDGTAGAAVETLTAIAGTGNVSFVGPVGSGTRLGAITISSATDLGFSGSVSVASLAQSAGTGTTTLNGAVNTNGAGGVSLAGTNLAVNAGITTTGGGAVTITESGTVTTAAAGDISSGAGVDIVSGGAFSSAGDIAGTTVSLTGVGLTNTGTITGTTSVTVDAGTGTLTNSGGTVTNGTGTSAPIALKGDSMALAGGTITGHAALVTLTSGTVARTIGLGAGSGLLLTQADLDSVTTTGGLMIGDPAHTGDIVVGGTINPLAGASGGFTINNGYDLSGGPTVGRIRDSGAGLIDVADDVMLRSYGDIGDSTTPVHIGSNAISLITSSEAGNAFTYIGKIGALVLSGVNSPGGQVFYSATGPISQSGPIAAGALHAIVTGAGGITLQDNLNTVTNLYLEAPGLLAYHQNAAYTVVEAKGSGMDFSSAGNLNLAPVTGSGPLNVDAGTGDVLLTTTGLGSAISVTGPGKVVAGNIKFKSANAVNLSGGSNVLNPGVSNDLSIKASGNLEVDTVSMKVSGGTAIAGLGQSLKNDAVIETGGLLSIKTSGDLTLEGGTATTSDGTAQAQANAFLRADKLDLKVGGNFYINGGTANLGGGEANASSIVFVKSGKGFDVTGDFVLTGGTITGSGTKATALAVFDPELALEIKTGGSVAVVGGTSPSSSANLLALASIQNEGPINFTIAGSGSFVHPDAAVAALLGPGVSGGLIVAGGKGSGLYDVYDNPVTANVYPITYRFTGGGAFTVITDMTNHSVGIVKSRTAIGVDESLLGYINFSINTETIAQSRRGATDQGNYKRKIAGQCS
ncbi:MAG: hypothetical protein OEL20_12885, partial [Sulfuritalea sp.]|nr:hypothetical protein [Sulfuritalea sp.]